MIGVDGLAIKTEDDDDPYGISSTHTRYNKQPEQNRDHEVENIEEEEDEEGDFINLNDDEPMDEEEIYQRSPDRGRVAQKENNSYVRRQTIGGQSSSDNEFRKSNTSPKPRHRLYATVTPGSIQGDNERGLEPQETEPGKSDGSEAV